MNKLHNFKFIGEFPFFQSQEEEGSFINGMSQCNYIFLDCIIRLIHRGLAQRKGQAFLYAKHI